MHHTKEKGDLGVFKAQVALCEQGWLVAKPLTEHAPFDLISYKNNIFQRIQVKYRAAVNGTIHIPFKSSWADKHGTHETKWDKSQIDIVCVYCPDTDKCYYFDPNDYKSALTIRIAPTQNHMAKNINWADNFLAIPGDVPVGASNSDTVEG